MYASEKNKRRRSRHLFFRRENEQTVCGADNEHGVRVWMRSQKEGGSYIC